MFPCSVCISHIVGGCLRGQVSFAARKKTAKKRVAELEKELALLCVDLESKERDFESQRAEVERLRRLDEQLGQLEQAGVSEAERLRTLASALAGNVSFLSCILSVNLSFA